MTEQVVEVDLRPSQQTSGAFLKDTNFTIVSAEAGWFTYPSGDGGTIPAALIGFITPDLAEPKVEKYGVGALLPSPSKNGFTGEDGKTPKGVGSKTEFGVFLANIVKAGMNEEELKGGLKALVGLSGYGDQIPFATKNKADKTIFAAVRDVKRGAAASSSTPAAGAPAVSGAATVDDETLAGIIAAGVAERGGSVPKSKIAELVTTGLGGKNPVAVGRAMQAAFQKGPLAEAGVKVADGNLVAA